MGDPRDLHAGFGRIGSGRNVCRSALCAGLLGLATAFLVAGPPPASAQDADPPASALPALEIFSVGDLDAARPAAVTPGLMLLGGGEWPYAAFRWLGARAGHGRILVLRASGTTEAQEEFFRQVGGVTGIETLVFHSRIPASDPTVLDKVARADGIFIAGGDQSNYVRFWKDTPLAAAIDRHVRAGKPLGGTSAGLAIQGAYLYGALDGGSITADEAMADPYGRGITLATDFLHLPFLDAVITDSHFGKRERLGRLVTWLARLRAVRPGIVGLGIDENAALCIDGEGKARIFTDTGGAAWLVRLPDQGGRIQAGRRLDMGGVRVTGIGQSSALDLKTMAVTAPAFERRAEVHHGKLRVQELGTGPVPGR